ncbi:uncharacterized protein LOC142983026 isoform X2 [Anticarsia gemmatalis]
MATIKKIQHCKTKSKIIKLFNKLKEQSDSSYETSQDTIITLDQTEEDNSETENVVKTPTLKRSSTTPPNTDIKRRKVDSSLIIINDDDTIDNANLALPQSPQSSKRRIVCSTPINSRGSNSLQNSIIKTFENSNTNCEEFNKEIVNLTEEIHKTPINLTKEINKDSYVTIDLTADSEASKSKLNHTVINLENTIEHSSQTEDCTIVSVIDDDDESLSEDSEVTVVRKGKRRKKKKKKAQLNTFAKGISKLSSTEKGKLLELITQNIFSGCKLPSNNLESSENVGPSKSDETESQEATYIKEVILGVPSHNSVGSNIYHPSRDNKNKTGLRMIVIDGSNVAMSHTRGASFSVKGLKICIDFFLRRGHVVKAFVPRFRCKYGKSSDPRLLDYLERKGLVIYTPSREIKGRLHVPYDDRYIVQCAAEFDGVIVSDDQYRDLLKENPRWRKVIETRLLQFTWVDDMIMFPKDPFGKSGMSLEELLRHPRSDRPPESPI